MTDNEKMTAHDAVHVLRLALVQAECAIKGREHTGFITKALVATEHVEADRATRTAPPAPVKSVGEDDEFIRLHDAMCWTYVENYVNGGNDEAYRQRELAKAKFIAHTDSLLAARTVADAPINMILHCPSCGLQHVDGSEFGHRADLAGTLDVTWTNPPHRSHLCHGCGHIWRPADVPTNGVKTITTKGKADSAIPVAKVADAPAEPSLMKAGPPEAEQIQLWKDAHGYSNQSTIGVFTDLYRRANPAKQAQPDLRALTIIIQYAHVSECGEHLDEGKAGAIAQAVIAAIQPEAGARDASPLPQGTPAAEVRDAGLEVPEGFALVPITITKEMQAAFWEKRAERPLIDLKECFEAAVLAANCSRQIATWNRSIAQEERACRAEDALLYLVEQISKTSPVDDHGHKLTMNLAYIKGLKLINDVGIAPRALRSQPAQKGGV